MASVADTELEDFRRKWQEEVQRRRDIPASASVSESSKLRKPVTKEPSLGSSKGVLPSSSSRAYDDDAGYGTYDFDDMEAHEASKKVRSGEGGRSNSVSNEPISALDHYELAVVRETEGKLGESLELYRKAFRLDDCVDQTYKNKHFPPSSFKPRVTGTTAVASKTKFKEGSKPGSHISALVASFAETPISGALPMISGDVPPPCPIKDLPSELLIDILDHVAHNDVATLSSLAKVSKRFAYLVTTQDSIWKGLVHSSRAGLGGMHHTYSKEISGAPLELSLADLTLGPSHRAPRTIPITLPLSSSYPTYRHMLQHRPRIRFSGVYISTVNYTRSGANDPNSLTWSTPIHVVTYYRYLRFYRDGTCISLLTTSEPLDVVPYLQKENIGGESVATTTLPIGVMRDARRGRWKITAPKELHDHEQQAITDQPPSSIPELDSTDKTAAREPTPITSTTSADPEHEPEGILSLETEGPTKIYQYSARFEIQSTGGNKSHASLSARNTKLVWRGFWSRNLITGDWAEFGLRNDRAYVWSRVRSWADA